MGRVPPVLILIPVINDLNDWVVCIFSKFTEAQHCGQCSSEGSTSIQKDPDRLKICIDKNLIKFNKENCKVLYQGRNNPRHGTSY